MRRIVLAATAALVWLGVAAAPASAHSVSGVSASNYHTHLTGVTPEVAGLEVKVIEAGSRLQVTNHTGQEVVVLGYKDEPYLRIGPDGVFQNKLSPATYINQTRKGNQPPASATDAKVGDTDWEKVSSSPVARWHDHRIHWM
ncbi:MAG: dye decolorizing peroxidase, partial [Actinomycetota bacterium]|nr:dye decolorizing peroxidase [Actinomycetota bacterium]